MTRPEQDKQQNMLDAFYNLFADIEPDTPEEVDEIIRSAGIDPDAYAAKINKLAQEALAAQARHQIEVARRQYDAKKSLHTVDRQTIIQQIQEMLSQLDRKNRAAFAHHRNLEAASDADLQSLLDDLSYLLGSDDASEQK